MAARTTITSANSAFSIIVPLVFPVPQNVQGYAADDAFATEAVDTAQVQMGVDGLMSAGFVPFPTKLNVTLMANSDSIGIFETWLQAMQAAREVFYGDATVVLPSVSRTFIFTKGVLNRVTQFPASKKVLQPVAYEITFQNMSVVPLAPGA